MATSLLLPPRLHRRPAVQEGSSSALTAATGAVGSPRSVPLYPDFSDGPVIPLRAVVAAAVVAATSVPTSISGPRRSRPRPTSGRDRRVSVGRHMAVLPFCGCLVRVMPTSRRGSGSRAPCSRSEGSIAALMLEATAATSTGRRGGRRSSRRAIPPAARGDLDLRLVTVECACRAPGGVMTARRRRSPAWPARRSDRGEPGDRYGEQGSPCWARRVQEEKGTAATSTTRGSRHKGDRTRSAHRRWRNRRSPARRSSLPKWCVAPSHRFLFVGPKGWQSRARRGNLPREPRAANGFTWAGTYMVRVIRILGYRSSHLRRRQPRATARGGARGCALGRAAGCPGGQ
jgi:hypothetical protein